MPPNDTLHRGALITEPPTTEPLTTEPPTTEPLITEPPTTEPLTTPLTGMFAHINSGSVLNNPSVLGLHGTRTRLYTVNSAISSRARSPKWQSRH